MAEESASSTTPVEAAVEPAGDEGLAPVPAGGGEATAPAAAEEAVVLHLEDLVPDDHGEVVILGQHGYAIQLVSDQGIAGAGVSEPHVTAGGLEVGGYAFYSFINGITVYAPDGEDLTVDVLAG